MIRIITLIFLAASSFVGSHATTNNETNNSTPHCDLIDKAQQGDTAAVRKMIKAGCAVNIKKDGKTPLKAAVSGNHTDIVWLLTQAGASVDVESNVPLLHFPARSGNTTIAWLLIEKGAAVDGKSSSGSVYGVTTALHVAAIYGNVGVMRLLIDKGATINMKDPSDRTPLHYAAKSGRAEAVRTLVKAGASIDALDSEGKTPLHHTVKDIVPYILVEMEIIKSTSPSIWSSSQKARVIGERKKLDDTARALVELGAKLNLADKITVTENIIGTSEDDVRTANTWIPLHYAAFHNRTAVIRILADAGAHLNPEDAKGNTPLHIASEQGNVDAIGVLFEVGADDRVKNKANHKANGVAMNDTIKTMVENPGVHWPLKAYAVGSVSSSSMDISMRITCEDARICRVFLDCFDKDGDRFQGWIGDLEKHRGKTTIGSIDQRATLSLSLSELKTLVDTTQVGGLDCALHSQQRIAAQVWSTTDSGSANITAYRLSEKHNVSEKAPVRFYYGDDSTPYIRFRCLADKGEECKNTEFQCADDEGADLATIKAGTVKRLHIYTVAGSHGTATGTGSNTASRTRANIGDNADYRILGTAKGWYSCKVSSSNPFMVYASDLIRTENVRFTANSTSISME